jgi:hypothetical protein
LALPPTPQSDVTVALQTSPGVHCVSSVHAAVSLVPPRHMGVGLEHPTGEQPLPAGPTQVPPPGHDPHGLPQGIPPLAQVGTMVVVVVLVVVVLVVVVLVVVVVVVVGHTSVTMPPPSLVTAGCTQLFSTMVSGEPPSGQSPAFVRAVENLPWAFGIHPASSAMPFAAAFW